jgi:biopolymer transport protein ExbD
MKVARRKFKVEVPSVAMGDIAFNLLIFFVILAKAQDDSHVQWTPAKDPKVEAAKSKVGIAVDNENKLYLNGRPISEAELASSVKEHLGDAPIGQRTVLVKVHNKSQALRFEKVLAAVSEAGGELVHILQKN